MWAASSVPSNNTSKAFRRILLFFHSPDPEISRTSSLRPHYIGRLSFPDLVFFLKYKLLLVLKHFPLGFFLLTSVSHSLPNPLKHTCAHTHTILSLFCCRRERSYREIKEWFELALRRMDMCYLEPRAHMSCVIGKMHYVNCFWLPSFNKTPWTLQQHGPSYWFFSEEVGVGGKEHSFLRGCNLTVTSIGCSFTSLVWFLSIYPWPMRN